MMTDPWPDFLRTLAEALGWAEGDNPQDLLTPSGQAYLVDCARAEGWTYRRVSYDEEAAPEKRYFVSYHHHGKYASGYADTEPKATAIAIAKALGVDTKGVE